MDSETREALRRIEKQLIIHSQALKWSNARANVRNLTREMNARQKDSAGEQPHRG